MGVAAPPLHPAGSNVDFMNKHRVTMHMRMAKEGFWGDNHCLWCRILLLKPRLVLMDEATSALDIGNEEILYRAIAGAGVTFVSVGHRPTLAEFHQRVLRLNPTSGGLDVEQSATWEVQATA